MFGKYFSHVLVLTLLAGTAYSLPQVKDAIGDAFAFGYTGQAAVIQALNLEPDQVVVKNITLKTIFGQNSQESSVSISANVELIAYNSDLRINSFAFALRNSTVRVDDIYTQSSNIVSDLQKDPSGMYVIKKGTKAAFSVTALANPATMIAGQYYATLVAATGDNKVSSPSNRSSLVSIVGENSPYITLIGSNTFGTKDSIFMSGVRLGTNPTLTITRVKTVGSDSYTRTIPIRVDGNSNQFKISLAQYNIPFGQYTIYIVNPKLGQTAGKSNQITINVIDPKKVVMATPPQNNQTSFIAPSNVRTVYAPASSSMAGSTTQQFSFTFSLTAGNYPAYVSKTQASVITASSNLNGISIALTGITDDNSSGDGTNYFYISPGQTKTFLATYSAVGMISGSGVFGASSINFGTTTASMNISLTTDLITNNLKAVLFH